MATQKIVGVKFKTGGKIYYFNPKELELKLNDKVVVETNLGIEMGTVSLEISEIDEKELAEPLKNVLRIANERDEKTLERIKERQKSALLEAKKLVSKMKLDMDLIDAEYTFDETKVIFTFTSEGRVDFRELVKELAASLRVRIELRQVGIRDEAKMLGGLGPCGREVCCSRHLRDFEKVSIKMAKNQGLSLNPTNISGLCGRLMCCLAYEDETYKELIKEMPRLNSKVKTKDGEGTVAYNNLLKKIVTVKLILPDESYKYQDYPLDEITSSEKGQADE